MILWRLLSFCTSNSTGGRAKTTADQQNEENAQTVHDNDIPERKVKGDRMTVVPGGGVCAQVAIGREDPHFSYKEIKITFAERCILFYSESNTTACV